MNFPPESALGYVAKALLAELTVCPRLISCDADGVPTEPELLARLLGVSSEHVVRAVRELVWCHFLRLRLVHFPGCEPATWLVIGCSE